MQNDGEEEEDIRGWVNDLSDNEEEEMEEEEDELDDVDLSS